MALVDPLPLGVVARAHGVHGELRVSLFDATSGALYRLAQVVLRIAGGVETSRSIEAARPTQGAVLLKLEGIDDRNAAEALRGAEVCARRHDLPPLAPGEFLVADLVGVEVSDRAGAPLGRVESTFRTAAHDVLVLHDTVAGIERLLALVPEQVVAWYAAASRLIVDAPEDLPESPLERPRG